MEPGNGQPLFRILFNKRIESTAYDNIVVLCWVSNDERKSKINNGIINVFPCFVRCLLFVLRLLFIHFGFTYLHSTIAEIDFVILTLDGVLGHKTITVTELCAVNTHKNMVLNSKFVHIFRVIRESD